MSDGRPPAADCNRLWALSGSVCARPGCDAPLVTGSPSGWVTVGQIAHIHAHSPDGPRYDPALPPALTDSFSNTMLLCQPHHREVDQFPEDFPADLLRRWKADHEAAHGPEGQPGGPSDSLGAMPPVAHGYLDRPALSRQVADRLAAGGPVVLRGMAGSGKSQLAAQLVADDDTHTFRWWLRAGTREGLVADLASLAPQVGLTASAGEPADALARRVVAELERRPGWLMVLDAAPDVDTILGLVPRTGGHVLLTTQHAGWYGAGRVLDMPDLKPHEARQVLRAGAGDVGDALLDDLADACGLLPIAVAQVAGYLSMTGAPARDFLSVLRSRPDEVMLRGSAGPHPSFGVTLTESLAALTVPARSTLKMLSYLAPVAIEVRATRGKDAEDPGNPRADVLLLEDALAALRAFSLVQREGPRVVVHELVQTMVRGRLAGTPQEAIAALRATDLVQELLPERIEQPQSWPLVERVLPHLEFLAALLPTVAVMPPSLVSYLLNKTATYYGARGDHDRELALLHEALEMSERESPYPADESIRATLLHNLGNALRKAGDHDAAAGYLTQSIALKERVFGPEHPLTGIAYAALGAVHEAIGDYRQARLLYVRALAVHQRVGAAARAADVLLDLANVALETGDDQHVDPLLDLAVRATHGAADAWPERAEALVRLAGRAAERGAPHDAVRFANRSRQAAYVPGVVWERLVDALTLEGTLRSGQGDAGGVALLEEVWRTLERDHGACLETAQADGNLGAGLCNTGRVEDGLVHLERSIAWLAANLPPDHPTVLQATGMFGRARAMLGGSSLGPAETPAQGRHRPTPVFPVLQRHCDAAPRDRLS